MIAAIGRGRVSECARRWLQNLQKKLRVFLNIRMKGTQVEYQKGNRNSVFKYRISLAILLVLRASKR